VCLLPARKKPFSLGGNLIPLECGARHIGTIWRDNMPGYLSLEMAAIVYLMSEIFKITTKYNFS